MSELGSLLAALDQAFDRKSWHGTNLAGSIRRVSAREASWRPEEAHGSPREGGARAHNVWELVVHCAYWKYSVWRRITGAPQGSFPLAGSNFFTRPDAAAPVAAEAEDEAAWKADQRLLRAQHKQLRAAVAALDPRRLGQVPQGSRFDLRGLISGAAAHDLYHAGQIQLLKRLLRGRKAD